MTQLTPTQRFSRRATDDPDFAKRVASVMGVIGVVAALTGIITGLVTAAHRVVVVCQNGDYVSGGEDPHCYSYAHLGTGLSLVMISVALLALTVLAYLAVSVVVASRHQRY